MQKENWRVCSENKYYEISNLGRVRSVDREIVDRNGKKYRIHSKLIKQNIDNNGYYFFWLHNNTKRKFASTHRIVASAFLKNIRKKEQVNHKDGNKLNNNVDNLEWCTRQENMTHAYKNGLMHRNYGADHHNSVLTEDRVIFIRQSNLPVQELVKIINVSRSTIYKVKQGNTYKNICGQ